MGLSHQAGTFTMMGSLRCRYNPLYPPLPFQLPPFKLSSTTKPTSVITHTSSTSSSMAITPTHFKPPASSPRKRSSKLTETSLRRVPNETATATPVSPTTAVSIPPKKVLVPIGLGTEEMEAVVIVDVLRRAGAEVLVASVEPELEVEAARGVRLVADVSIASCSDQIFDLVALPGGMPGSARLRDCEILRQITTKQAEEKRLLGAICAAPAVTLLPWGHNTMKRMTCHPAFIDKLPTFWAVKSDVQISGQLTTSRGPGTSFQFSLCLAEQLFGKSVSKQVQESLLMNDADDTRRKKEEFNRVEWSLDHNPQVLIPVANGSHETEVVAIVDILRRANADVVVASVEQSLQILGSGGTKIVADKLIVDVAESTYDLIILPGEISGTEKLHKCKILKKLLKEQKSQGRIYGGTCSSPALLQDQGLLKYRKATAHPSYVSKLISEEVNGAEVVIDGKLITGKGLSTVTDFALTIVSKLFGDGRARSVARGLVFDYRRG